MWNPPVRAMPTVLPPGKGVPQPDDDDQEEGEASLAPSYGATYGRPTAGGGDDGPRQSSNIEAAVLFAELVRIGLKVICFCSVRLGRVSDTRRPHALLTPRSSLPPLIPPSRRRLPFDVDGLKDLCARNPNIPKVYSKCKHAGWAFRGSSTAGRLTHPSAAPPHRSSRSSH